jgi:putative acetyltransferase
MPEILIRPETSADRPAIRTVVAAAFGQPAEADLVDALRDNGGVTLSLVAEREGEIVGHILFSPVTVESGGGAFAALGLAPMAVAPSCQRQGIGSRLIRAGLEECRRVGHEVVVVLGHPEYYPRFGFVPSKPLGIRYVDEVPDDVFMVLELRRGALAGRGGVVRYRPEFGGV